MSIRVLLADDSEVMRAAIVRLLKEEPSIELVGEVASFAETLHVTAALQPDVLLLDLHMRDEGNHPPEFVKTQVCQHTGCILAISVWNDEKAKALADRFGAQVLLDKTKLFSELIPAIMRFCVNRSITKTAMSRRERTKRTPGHQSKQGMTKQESSATP